MSDDVIQFPKLKKPRPIDPFDAEARLAGAANGLQEMLEEIRTRNSSPVMDELIRGNGRVT